MLGWLEGQTGGQRVGRAARGRADFLRRPPLTPTPTPHPVLSLPEGRSSGRTRLPTSAVLTAELSLSTTGLDIILASAWEARRVPALTASTLSLGSRAHASESQDPRPHAPTWVAEAATPRVRR